MDSETFCFEDDTNNRHLIFIPKKLKSLAWTECMTDEIRKLKLKCNLLVYHNVTIIHHSDFYEREMNSKTGNFKFLKKYNLKKNCPIKLIEIEKNVLLLYRENFSGSEVCEALGLKEGTLKKHNKNIFDKTGIRQMKKFAR